MVASADESEPDSVSQALESLPWRIAMKEEFDALMRNNTWSLVPPSRHQKLVGNKWIFKVKRNSDGSVQRHKARLVAK